MYNVSTEQIIKVKAPKNAFIFKIIMIIACILAVTTIPQTHAFGLLLFVVLVVFTVLYSDITMRNMSIHLLTENLQ